MELKKIYDHVKAYKEEVTHSAGILCGSAQELQLRFGHLRSVSSNLLTTHANFRLPAFFFEARKINWSKVHSTFVAEGYSLKSIQRIDKYCDDTLATFVSAMALTATVGA
jgi:hypothetical protein